MSDDLRNSLVQIDNISGRVQFYLRMSEYGYEDIRLEIASHESKSVANCALSKTELAALASAIQEFLR